MDGDMPPIDRPYQQRFVSRSPADNSLPPGFAGPPGFDARYNGSFDMEGKPPNFHGRSAGGLHGGANQSGCLACMSSNLHLATESPACCHAVATTIYHDAAHGHLRRCVRVSGWAGRLLITHMRKRECCDTHSDPADLVIQGTAQSVLAASQGRTSARATRVPAPLRGGLAAPAMRSSSCCRHRRRCGGTAAAGATPSTRQTAATCPVHRQWTVAVEAASAPLAAAPANAAAGQHRSVTCHS